MTEEEFKANYVKSFLEAYKTIVGFKFSFPKSPSSKELLQIAKDKAEIAWQRYLKDNAV